jgi:hypothetical protein
VEEVSGSDGMAAGVKEVTRMQFSRGEIGQYEDAGSAGGGRELVKCGGERCASFDVMTGLEVSVASRGGQVSGTVIS